MIPQNFLELKDQLLFTFWANPLLDDDLWASKNVVGCATTETKQGPRIDIFLRDGIPTEFKKGLTSRYPDYPFRFFVTGPFRFAAGLGIQSGINLADLPGGKIGLYLQDTQGRNFALTCSHVLDQAPDMTSPQPVLSDGKPIGTLYCRIAISTDGLKNPSGAVPIAPNLVDCALALLNEPANNIMPNGIRVTPPIVIGQTDGVASMVGKKGSIRTVDGDIQLPYDAKMTTVYFSDLILASSTDGRPLVQPGDSGSLVVDANGKPTGIVIGYSEQGLTFDHPSVDYGPIVAICDLQKILDQLRPLTGALAIV